MRNQPHFPPRVASSRPNRRTFLGLGAAAAAGATLPACRSVDPRTDGHEPADGELRGALNALASELTDQSDRYEPITATERARRRTRLAGILTEAGIDALLVEAGATLDYLAGVSWGHSERLFALVVLADGDAFWIVPAFEEPRASARIVAAGWPSAAVVTWEEHEYAMPPLAAELNHRGVERIAIDPGARAFVDAELATAFGRARVVAGRPIVRTLRGCKDAHEIALLRGANELTQRAITAVSEVLAPGMTDHEIGTLMRAAQENLGLVRPWVLPLLGDGAALPHGAPDGRALTRGEVVLIDTGGGLHGYQSDITRTWIFDGKPTGEVAQAWNTVRDAQQRAFEAMRPGVPCRVIDETARRTIAGAGYGEGYATFAHRLGHGIGLQGHEDPYLDGGSDVLLAPGMTFSDEPGIYLPGRFGIRLEDIVVVTADGADHFGNWPSSPLTPA